MGSNKYVPSSWRCSQRGTMGPPSLVNFDIFLLHGVAASLRAIPMSQSSAPPPSVAPGPDFCFDNYEESEVCQFAILRTRPPEEAFLYGGAWGRSCTSLPGGPSKGLSFRPSKTDRRLKSPTNVKGQPPGPRIRRESEVVATSGVLVNRREVVGSFDISATLELHAPSGI